MSHVLLAKTTEIDRNRRFFVDALPSMLAEHEGEYVLMRDATVIAFFSTPLDAQIAGNQQFPDHRFSIQRVKARPEELGYFSYAAHSRTP